MIIDAVCVDTNEVSRRQIKFEDGIISGVGHNLGKADYQFGDDCLLFTGMGDVHIHAREDVSGQNNYKEDFCTACAAMHNGGVTHAGDMPNNPIPPVDDQSYEAKFKLASKADGNLWMYAGIGPGTSPLSYPVPYKVYMGPSVGELFFKDLQTLDETLKRYRGQHVSFHCEDPEILNASKNQPAHHLKRPPIAEVVATRDALHLIEKYELKGKLCHYSTSEGLDLIRRARSRGVDVSIEVTPQHLYFDIEHIESYLWNTFQMNPPIRTAHDREALMQALKSGEINFLATDHAPHTKDEKLKGTSGLTGLDTYGPFVSWLLKMGVSPMLIGKVTAENPGNFFNQFLPSWKKIRTDYQLLGLGLGHLKPGYCANFTIINLNRPVQIQASMLKTKVGHSPFLGETFPGSLEAVFIRGKKI